MGFIAKQEATFDKYRFGVMCMMIMIQATWGSIAAYLSILNNIWLLVVIATLSAMLANAMFIAQAKAKVCLIGFWLSMVLSTIIIAINTVIFVV